MQSFLQVDLFLLAITAGRLTSIVAGVFGIISIISGRRALVRSARNIDSRRQATVALVLGLIGVAVSVVHLASTTGGFGTGKGRAGAIIALVLGLIGTIFSGLAIGRSRRNKKKLPV